MTLRQRPASGGAPVVVPAEASPSGNGSVNGDGAVFRWDAWFASASPDQRVEAMRLAEQQGLVYLQQLPAAAAKPRATGPTPPLIPILSRMLAGKADGLPPLSDAPLAWCDTELDALQREAVRRALNTPDVCLLQGLPGTGKSRVVTEVIAQAGRRGWRVLLLAATAPAVDVVLERLAGCADVLPIRLLTNGDEQESLPALLRSLTLAEQRRALRERTLAGARQARRDAEDLSRRREQEESIWPQLPPLGERIVGLHDRRRGQEQRLLEIGGEVEREAASRPAEIAGTSVGAFGAELAALSRRTATALGEWEAADKLLREKQDTLRKEHERIDRELAALEPRCKAREAGRWWAPSYWLGASALRARDDLYLRRDEVAASLKEAEQALTAHTAARRQIEDKDAAERKELVRGEIERREREVRSAIAAIEQELVQAQRSWQTLCEPIQPPELRPAGYRASDIETARERWQGRRRRDAEAAKFGGQWADYLEQACEQLPERLPALANVIAAPIAALTQGREWSEVAGTPFDLLVIEDAERVTDAELLGLAVHAPRLLLVSEAAAEGVAIPPAAGKAPRSLHGLAPLAACWSRLWQALGEDLGQLAYAWKREANRLTCQLAIVRGEDTRYLEKESLADAPEIELHILNLPRAKPVLARVSFPAGYTVAQATAFIHRELEELPIQPLGRTAWWDATSEAVVLHLGPTTDAATDCVDLGSGVRLLLRREDEAYAGCAARLEFSRAGGWDRAAVEKWLQTHLHWRGHDRAVYLQVPHRQCRSLAELVGPLLFAEVCLAQLLARAASNGHFEFVPVPALRKPEWPREGAGLEQDLATGRHGDRLPSDLRGELPRKGIVNFLEAQALVRRLEHWAQTPGELNANGQATTRVLVVALYDAQAELLRRLVERSAILKSRPLALEIAAPGQVRQRECDVLVVSLTRSHTHRSVAFGEDVADLAVTLTRARQRLLIFGDPGTLMRRCQWQGPLEHLDPAQAHLEGQRLGRLMRHVQSSLGLAGTPAQR